MFKRFRFNKGSMTVEASIIVPTVIICIVLIICMTCMLFQRAYIQAEADMAADRGAVAWLNPASDVNTGKVHIDKLDDDGLYWRVIDRNNTHKANATKEYFNLSLSKNILKKQNNSLDVKVIDQLINKSISIEAHISYDVPVAGLMSLFGLGDSYTINVKSQSLLDEPSEFLRNVDFIIDIEKELEKRFPEIRNTREKVSQTISDIKKKADMLFEPEGSEPE